MDSKIEHTRTQVCRHKMSSDKASILKFSDVVSLENDVAVWNKLVQGGLPQGQLSFLVQIHYQLP